MANFCKYCGKALQDGEICTCPQAQAEAAAAHSQGQPFYQQPQYQQPQYQQPPYQQPQYQQPYDQPAAKVEKAVRNTDHTAEFDPKDISDNKLPAMLGYIAGYLGIIVALLMSPDSPYVKFHVREALKIAVLSTVVGLASSVLIWTFIVPIAGAIAVMILVVVEYICFFQVWGGTAKEAPVVNKFNKFFQ